MDQTQLIWIVGAAIVGVVASLVILRRERGDARAASPAESPFAVSTEGEKRCPKCGMGNMWTDATCASCGAKLPG